MKRFSRDAQTSGLWCAYSTRVNGEAIDIRRIRTEFLRQAVLWVCELAAHDRLEARDLAGELRRYFESVVDSIPSNEKQELSQQIDEICGRLGQLEIVRTSTSRN